MQYRPTRPSDLIELRLLIAERWLPGRAYYNAYKGLSDYPENACEHERRMTSEAEIYYVTSDMVDLLQAAAPKMPEQPLRLDDPPSQYGFIYFEKPIVGTDSERGITINVDAITWGCIMSGVEHERPLERMVSITCYQYDDKPWPEEVVEENPELAEPLNDWAPLGRSEWPVGDTTDQPEWEGIEPARMQSFSEDRRWLAAFWTLIQQVKIAECSQVGPQRQHRKRLEREGKPISLVNIVRLRRIQHPTQPKDEAALVEWTHRWMVGVHWRNQWYPSLGTHRQIVILPYVKGPEDKPLIIKDTVKLWER